MTDFDSVQAYIAKHNGIGYVDAGDEPILIGTRLESTLSGQDTGVIVEILEQVSYIEFKLYALEVFGNCAPDPTNFFYKILVLD